MSSLAYANIPCTNALFILYIPTHHQVNQNQKENLVDYCTLGIKGMNLFRVAFVTMPLLYLRNFVCGGMGMVFNVLYVNGWKFEKQLTKKNI